MKLAALFLVLISSPLVCECRVFSQHGPPGELEVVGVIRLYKEVMPVVQVATNIYSRPSYNYYAQKDHIYKIVFSTDWPLERQAQLDTLKTFLSDDPEILKKIESEEYKHKRKSFIQIVKEYNLKHFKGVGNSAYTTKSAASFYTTVGPKVRDKLRLKVNDSIEYTIHPRFPTPVKLAASAPSKVCLISNNGMWCELMAPDPEGEVFYELDYSPGDKSFEIEKRTLNQYKSYLSNYVVGK